MNNPGIIPLGDFTIGAAATQIGTVFQGLDGMLGATLQVRLAYGSGGTTCKIYLQTSFDQGNTWVDIACITFSTAGGVFIVNVSALQAVTTPVAATDGGLADNTVLNGPLGDRLRVKVVSTGTYGGSTLASCRAAVR